MRTSKSIIVVEDECIAGEDIRRRLMSWGYQVPAVVASGEEAIRTAERVHPDVVLMDIHLKGTMDGVQAAATIRERLDVPVIYATAYNDVETLSRVGVGGPFEMINKPYDDLEIRAAVELALTRRRFERRLNDLESRHRSLLALINEASRYAVTTPDTREAHIHTEDIVGWASSEVDVPLHTLRRCIGSLHATELTNEQREILETVELSLRSLETLVDQIQQ